MITSLADLKHQTYDLFLNAKRSVQIYTHGLDPRILDNREVERALLAFIKRSRHSKVQLLNRPPEHHQFGDF